MKFQNFEQEAKESGLGSDWMRLEDGENKIRILTEPEKYVTHYVDKKNVACEGEDCAYCTV